MHTPCCYCMISVCITFKFMLDRLTVEILDGSSGCLAFLDLDPLTIVFGL